MIHTLVEMRLGTNGDTYRFSLKSKRKCFVLKDCLVPLNSQRKTFVKRKPRNVEM